MLLFGGNSVLCANSPLNISYFQSKGKQYIGSPWNNFQHIGGAGDLSLRNRTQILQAIKKIEVLLYFITVLVICSFVLLVQFFGHQTHDRVQSKRVKEDIYFVRALIEDKVSIATETVRYHHSNCFLFFKFENS